jgi:subtilisin family serine protease
MSAIWLEIGAIFMANGALSKVRSISISVAVCFFTVSAVFAQSTDTANSKASAAVLQKFTDGTPQDLIVVFDDSKIQKDALVRQATAKLASRDKSIIEYKAGRFAALKSSTLSTVDSTDVAVLKPYNHLPMSFIRIKSRRALDALLANSAIVAVYENTNAHHAMLAQSLPLIGQPQAAAAGDQGIGTTVAVLDERVDYTNAAFGSCTAPGNPTSCRVVVAQDAPGLPNDGLGSQDNHGTNVAATIAAAAPGTKIISLNVFNGTNASVAEIVDAVEWCISNVSIYNIVAMNLSLEDGKDYVLPTTASAYYPAFQAAISAGILPIVAAGNDGYSNGLSSPAAVVGAVSVGAVYDSAYGAMAWGNPLLCNDATTATDQIACFSNSASFLTVLAPGCRDDAALASPNYKCGTSQATPHVAGAVAVLRATFPSDTLNQTIGRLTNGVPITDNRNGVTKPRLYLPTALGLAGCSYTISPISISIGASGTNNSSISVANRNACSWIATSNVNWITLLAGNSGSGNGTVNYYVAANNSTSTRTGTISIAGQIITVNQAAGAGSLSSSTNVWLIGEYSYSYSNLNSITLTVPEILYTGSGTTGTLRLELWLTSAPFSFGENAWRIATYRITGSSNGTLGPHQSFNNIVVTVPLTNLPSPGTYYPTLLVSQYNSLSCASDDNFCTDTYGGFNGMFYIPDITPPTVPAGLTASAGSPSQVSLSWIPSTDDVGVTAYQIYNNGVLLGSVSTVGASIYNLLPSTTYQFTVSACDAAQNCSAQSSVAPVTTLTGNAFQVDVRTYVPYAAASGGYQSFLRVINTGGTPTPITVARIDGLTGMVSNEKQLTSALPAGGAMTFNAQQVEAAMNLSLAASDRPRIRVGANVSIGAQSFMLQPGGVFNEVSPAQSGSSIVVQNYIPAAAAVNGYESFLRVINTGNSATPVTIARTDPTTGLTGTTATLVSSMEVGAAMTFNASQIESALGLTLSAADRPQMLVSGASSTLDAQSFFIQPGGAFTDVSSSQIGATINVRTYVPASVSGYVSYIKIINNGSTAAPVNATVIDGQTGMSGATGTIIPSLGANESVTLTSTQIEAALGVSLPAADRPRISINSVANLTAQSYLLQPGGAFNEVSGAQTGTTLTIGTYIPAADAVGGYTSFIRIINTGTTATPIQVAMIDGVSGIANSQVTLIPSLPAGAAWTLSSAQFEAALGTSIQLGTRPRIQFSGAGGNIIEVQSFLIQPGGAFTNVSGGQ